jgi:hypothetical protein
MQRTQATENILIIVYTIRTLSFSDRVIIVTDLLRYLSEILKRAKYILAVEGWKPLLLRGFDYLRRRIFTYGNYYICEYSMKERNEDDFLPKIRDFDFKIVSSNEEANRIAKSLGYDFRHFLVNARHSLDKGAVAFCIFVDGEIANTGWVGMSEEAKNAFDRVPYFVDFAHGEACTGGTETIPRYRSKGLMAYSYFKRFQYMRDKGITISRNCVAMDNVASQKAHARFNPRITAQAKYLRLLGINFYQEKPFNPTREVEKTIETHKC